MASLKPSSRYTNFDTRSSSSSHLSDPSSSTTDLKTTANHHSSALNRLISRSKSSSAAAFPQPPSSAALSKIKNDQNLSAMVKKFMDKRSKPKPKTTANAPIVIQPDFIAEDLKKTARKGSNFTAFHRKLFSKDRSSGGDVSEKKALTEVKANTRTLAMVLRSERELLSQNKELELEVAELKLTIDEKNREAEKLKDLCLKQREEIKALKSAILFPDVMNSQLQDILEKQGSELKQAKQVIPTLQRQVTSLTGQLQWLAEDLAEVKADKYSVKTCFEGSDKSPRTPVYGQEAANSLEFSSDDATAPGSPDDMLMKDLNPCLTPYSVKTKSKEFTSMGYQEKLVVKNTLGNEILLDPHITRMSKSSDNYQGSNPVRTMGRAVRRSDENKCVRGRQTSHQKLV